MSHDPLRTRVVWVMGDLGRGGIRLMADQVIGSLGLGSETLAVLDPLGHGETVGTATARAVSTSRGSSKFGRIRGLRRLVRTEAPDVLIALGYSPATYAWLAAALSFRRPAVICSARNSLDELEIGRGRRRAVKRLLVRFVLRRCDLVVAISHALRDELAEKMPRLRVAVVLNGLRREIELAALQSRPRSRVPTASGLRVAVVGRLDVQKDPLLALHSFALAREPGWSLVFVGDGPLDNAVATASMALGIEESVDRVGWVADAAAHIAAADVLLVTSHYEGFCNVILEAMALGTPVVSVDCPSGPAELLKGGELGWLVPRRNSHALAAALSAVAAEPETVHERTKLALEASHGYGMDATRAAFRQAIADAIRGNR